MIYVTGDIHGEVDISKLNTQNFSQAKEGDYLIICGDFGKQCQRTGILLFLTGHGMAG